MSNEHSPPCTGLILPGGGARAAYQVGVLKAVATLHGHGPSNPFPVISGTSAGAINAIGLASRANHFGEAVKWLEALWLELEPDDVYRSDWWGTLRNAWRLTRSLFNAGIALGRPVALLDNSPLRELLTRNIQFNGISEHIKNGHLHAINVTAMNYTEGDSISFFQGGHGGWQRWRRRGIPTPLQVQHVLASTAIPTIFPPQRIGRNYYGDGALRQLTPISPALHLGATRVLIIPASGHQRSYERPIRRVHSPAFGQVIGHLLNSAFIDSIETDIERLERINELIRLMPEGQVDYMGHKLRVVESMVVSPSQDIDTLAEDHVSELPRSVKTFLRGTGSGQYEGGVNVASYLLFTQDFIRALIDMGYEDGLAQGKEIRDFFSLGDDIAAGT